MAGLLMVLLGGLLEVCSGVSANRGGYPSFTDEIPFKINWPGAEFTMVCLCCYLGEHIYCKMLFPLSVIPVTVKVINVCVCVVISASLRCTLQGR